MIKGSLPAGEEEKLTLEDGGIVGLGLPLSAGGVLFSYLTGGSFHFLIGYVALSVSCLIVGWGLHDSRIRDAMKVCGALHTSEIADGACMPSSRVELRQSSRESCDIYALLSAYLLIQSGYIVGALLAGCLTHAAFGFVLMMTGFVLGIHLANSSRPSASVHPASVHHAISPEPQRARH